MSEKERKILIVDDDFVGRKKIEATLRRYGTCSTVSDGKFALGMFDKAHAWSQPYALITMDIEMPGLNGWDTIRSIREWEEDNLDDPEIEGVKIVVISGRSEPESVLSAFRYGCESFITKPVNPGKLRIAMQELGLDEI